MSMQFGIWYFDGKRVDAETMRRASSMLIPFAPDRAGEYQDGNISVIHHALHTTAEARNELQPCRSASGDVILWDGRLDNRMDLLRELRGSLTSESPDSAFVSAAFERWGKGCFTKLLGDWAIAIWDSRHQTLILAKDVIGIRPLYYHLVPNGVRWSSSLDPLVLLYEQKFNLNLDYVAGWLGAYPAANATPYTGIHSVPPASFVLVSAGKHIVSKYWDFDGSKRITYRTDTDYEEHFLAVFREAVRRRLRSDRPICAELSGGMDSSCITCMGDAIAASSPSDTPSILTLSYFDDSERNADDRPYFSKVEEQRGKTGCHIDIGGRALFAFDNSRQFEAIPGQTISQPDHLRAEFLQANGIRVVLSGLGGDEVMGGVPAPIPELQDLLVQGQLRLLAHQVKMWALYKRKPWFHLLGEVIRGLLPASITLEPKYLKPTPWLTGEFLKRYRADLTGTTQFIRVRGVLPSFQSNLITLDMLRRQLGTKCSPLIPPHERRYPYLDRDLLEFVYAVPREQLLRPSHRRSLMRRSLLGIVPAEIIERKRKAFTNRGPRAAISNEWQRLSLLSTDMVSSRFGIVDEPSFRDALLSVGNSDQIPLVKLMRAVFLEAWMRNVDFRNILSEPSEPSGESNDKRETERTADRRRSELKLSEERR